MRPLTPASRVVATAAAAAAWPNSTFCALHTTAFALNATRTGIAERPPRECTKAPGLRRGCSQLLPLILCHYLEARATRPVAAALAVRMERAISTGFDAQRRDQAAADVWGVRAGRDQRGTTCFASPREMLGFRAPRALRVLLPWIIQGEGQVASLYTSLQHTFVSTGRPRRMQRTNNCGAVDILPAWQLLHCFLQNHHCIAHHASEACMRQQHPALPPRAACPLTQACICLLAAWMRIECWWGLVENCNVDGRWTYTVTCIQTLWGTPTCYNLCPSCAFSTTPIAAAVRRVFSRSSTCNTSAGSRTVPYRRP